MPICDGCGHRFHSLLTPSRDFCPGCVPPAPRFCDCDPPMPDAEGNCFKCSRELRPVAA